MFNQNLDIAKDIHENGCQVFKNAKVVEILMEMTRRPPRTGKGRK
jgi:hypothetical protein